MLPRDIWPGDIIEAVLEEVDDKNAEEMLGNDNKPPPLKSALKRSTVGRLPVLVPLNPAKEWRVSDEDELTKYVQFIGVPTKGLDVQAVVDKTLTYLKDRERREMLRKEKEEQASIGKLAKWKKNVKEVLEGKKEEEEKKKEERKKEENNKKRVLELTFGLWWK